MVTTPDPNLVRLDGDLRVLVAEVRALHSLVDERFQARDRALDVVAQETRRAQAQSNEWRGALSDLSATKVDATQFESRIKAIEDKIDLLREEVTASRGLGMGQDRSRNLLFATIAAGTAIFGVVVALAVLLAR
jgi:hypothetical protein